MNQKALKSLEYYKIIDQLAEKASSPMGKDLCKHLLPSEDVYEIRHMQTQTTEKKRCPHPPFPEGKHLLRKRQRRARFPEASGDRKFSRNR